MRVQNGAVDNTFRNAGSSAVQNQGVDARSGSTAPGGKGADQVQLSKASTLVALAKATIPADKQAHFEAVSARFNSGRYAADVPATSQAIVQGHLQR